MSAWLAARRAGAVPEAEAERAKDAERICDLIQQLCASTCSTRAARRRFI
jgi:hypothetical protein